MQSRVVEMASPRERLLRWIPTMRRSQPTALSELRELGDLVARDRRVEGVLVVLLPFRGGWATAEGLREVLRDLRAHGKRVVVHLPEGGGNRELFVASAADEVHLAPQATLMALGLAAESRYFKPLLDKLGVGVETFARGEYKTAAESLTRDAMSTAQREQVGALLGAIDGRLRAGLAERERIDSDSVASLFAAGFLRGDSAVAAGVVDGTAYEDELPAVLGTEGQVEFVPAARYAAFHRGRFFRRMRPEPYVGVIPIRGAIGSRVRADAVVTALRVARSEERVRAVILYIDSPGGSATVSDRIHREVVRLKEKKPVIAYFGDVAASGGYYVGAPATQIVAQPSTITGSIGVVSARVVARQLLDHLGVRTEVLRTAPHADMFSPARDLEEAERGIIERELDGFYRSFVDIVAAGRGRKASEIEPLARGRVWSGADAKERGLVDELGGMDKALAIARTEAGDASLPARGLHPRRVEVPSPEPAAAAAAFLSGLAPELSELLEVLGNNESVLFWCPSVPRIG